MAVEASRVVEGAVAMDGQEHQCQTRQPHISDCEPQPSTSLIAKAAEVQNDKVMRD